MLTKILMRFSRIRIFYVFQLEKEKTGEGKHLLEKRVPFPCSASTARPIPSSPKPPNVIEYLLAVSGKMKNHRKAIALEPLWQLHKKSSRNIPGTFFHNRNSCRITSPPVNILRVGVRGRELFTKAPSPGNPSPYLRWAAISSRYSGRTSKPNSMALSAYSAALS